MRHFGDKMYFVFRNFPLNDIHPPAQAAAEAPEAAAAQDKFWEMHDYLFEHQKALDYNHLLKYAQEVGLDLDKFKKDMSRHSGVEGTPTFFINGVRYEDSRDLKILAETLQKYLATQTQ
jgi:protein-disulfide isomerase